MRFRSLTTLLFISFTVLGLTLAGCGSSDGSKYVANTPQDSPTTGGLRFAFEPEVLAQSPFIVDANTAKLVFRFFASRDGSGEPVDMRTHDFLPTIVIENLSPGIQSVRITGFDANGVPLFNITQGVSVIAGETTPVSATAVKVPVVLESVRFTASASPDSSEVSAVNVGVGDTAQVYLQATYDDGTVIVANNAGAEFLNDPADPESASVFGVSASGLITGVGPGLSTMIANFGELSLSLPVEVSETGAITFVSLSFDIDVEDRPIEVGSEDEVPVPVVGLTSNGSVVLASPLYLEYDYRDGEEDDVFFSVFNGILTVFEFETPPTSTLTNAVIATYVNANGSKISTEPLEVIFPGSGDAAP